MSQSAEKIAADYQRTVPNTNSLSERLAAAHARNVERAQAVASGTLADYADHARDVENVLATSAAKHLTAKQYAYESGVKLLYPLCLRLEEAERQIEWLKEELVRLSAPPHVRGVEKRN